jgi:AcrR family transcriptional regulator
MRRKLKAPANDPHGVRARALEAATDILTQLGIEKLNLRMIADRAGIGLTSIYYYFASKEQLLLSLALAGFEEIAGDIARAVAGDADHPFRAGSQAYLAYAQRRPARYALMFDERLMARHEELRQAANATFEQFREIVRHDPRFPSEKADGIAWTLWALGRGMSAMALSQPGGITPEQQALFSVGVGFLISRG